MGPRTVATARGGITAALEAVPSKSVTHRALIAAALGGTTRIEGALAADDTRVTIEGLRSLGIPARRSAEAWIVEGGGGSIPGGGRIDLLESGTSFRFLTAVAALGARPSRLDGARRLRERPIGDLARVLEQLGATVEVDPGGGLPLTIGGSALRGGCRVSVAGDRSSQFASALMLIGCRLPGGLEVAIEPPAVSLPYVEITEQVLGSFGVPIERISTLGWRVPEAIPRADLYRVEGDHSSASYFLAAAAIVGGSVRVHGIRPDSRQPDSRLADLLGQMGCEVEAGSDFVAVTGSGRLQPFDLEMSGAPDLAPTVAVLGAFADGPSTIRGIGHLRHKESDRLELLAKNLTALGRPALARDDRLEIGARRAFRPATIETRSDHRMAMAFAVAGLAIEGVVIDDADCVAKSNPEFWRQFAELTS